MLGTLYRRKESTRDETKGSARAQKDECGSRICFRRNKQTRADDGRKDRQAGRRAPAQTLLAASKSRSKAHLARMIRRIACTVEIGEREGRVDVPGALSAGCRKIRPVGIGLQIARRSHPLAASYAAAAATDTPVMRLCMCWLCMSRAHDPDPGTPGDLDPSRVRKLLHRTGVCNIDDRADGPACMHSRDSIAQCMPDMLEIAQVRGVRLRYGSEGPPVRMSGTSTTSRRHMGRHSSVVRGKQPVSAGRRAVDPQ